LEACKDIFKNKGNQSFLADCNLKSQKSRSRTRMLKKMGEFCTFTGRPSQR
jgi:hypothetical protein